MISGLLFLLGVVVLGLVGRRVRAIEVYESVNWRAERLRPYLAAREEDPLCRAGR